MVEGPAVLVPAAIVGFHATTLHLDDQHAAIGIDEDEVPLPLGAGVVVDAQGVPGDPTGGRPGGPLITDGLVAARLCCHG